MIPIIGHAQLVFDVEIESLIKVRNELDESFSKLVEMIMCSPGKVILTGMGKSGHVAKKISATLSSLGTPAYYLHPGEGAHGDLGMVTENDIVIAFSSSGETDEIINLLPSIKRIGAKIVSITCRSNSTLEEYSDHKIRLKIVKEASLEELAPTTSTTAMLVFGDALAVVLSKLKGFEASDFALFHPKGSLGKKLLLRVMDLMSKGEENPTVCVDGSLKSAIIEISKKGLGVVCVIDSNNKLVGILTDGDLRRILEANDNISAMSVMECINRAPITVRPEALAIEALKVMEMHDKTLTLLPVVDGQNCFEGVIRMVDIVKAGVV